MCGAGSTRKHGRAPRAVGARLEGEHVLAAVVAHLEDARLPHERPAARAHGVRAHGQRLDVEREQDGRLGGALHGRAALRHERHEALVRVHGQVEVVAGHGDLACGGGDDAAPLVLRHGLENPRDVGDLLKGAVLLLEVGARFRGEARENGGLDRAARCPQARVLRGLPAAALDLGIELRLLRPRLGVERPDELVQEHPVRRLHRRLLQKPARRAPLRSRN